jgi:serine phosphatase RsbU (regulator of sigma subunit)
MELEQTVEERTHEVVEQKEIIEEKQKEILDSIEYALRIQTAILPPQKIVKQHLENSFILYKPKDIVAGDFYWMETVQLADERISELANENKFKNNQLINPSANQLILFAACDCTGHGVPGAMVSVVCHNALNRAVHEFGLTTPAAILDKTAEIVVENFAKSEEEIKDGMDISLCALNFNKVSNIVKVELQWAGANNPLWLIRNGEFEETKADKQPIGMNEDHHPFTNHTFNLEKGDTIYIFSDGFADQFSPADKKLMKKNFKNVLLNIQDKNMQEQHTYLNTFIENWKGTMEQTDDILVIGVKV